MPDDIKANGSGRLGRMVDAAFAFVASQTLADDMQFEVARHRPQLDTAFFA